MSVGDVLQHLYLPLLTQETAVMISALTFGAREGVSVPVLVAVNTAAVLTDLVLFFMPTYFLSRRLHAMLIDRFQERYDQGRAAVAHFGALRTAAMLGFVMPSVAAMVVVGLLRLSFWRALAGLFLGSSIYVVLPLLVALPLSSALPAFVIPILPWVAPALAAVLIVYAVIRASFRRHATAHT